MTRPQPSRANRRRLAWSTQAVCQALESRRLLCTPEEISDNPLAHDHPQFLWTEPGLNAEPEGGAADIVWVNRGQASDRFTSTFGANANAARAVVDAVIESWERVITSFNYSDGSTTYSLTLSMDDDGTSRGAAANVSTYLDGKPKSGTVTMGRGQDTNSDGIGDGSGWFLDPTPDEHSEFLGAIDNAFAGRAQVGSPAAGISDFYAVVNAELTHCMGLIHHSQSLFQDGGFNTDTGVTDNAEGGGLGNFFRFESAPIDHLMTSNNSGASGDDFGVAIHTAGPTANVNSGGQNYRGADDIGNVSYSFGQRVIVNDVMARVFEEVYDYTIALPQQFGTFYASVNGTSGELFIRGGTGTSNDTIAINMVGGAVQVSVDVGNDVPGTGMLSGAGNLPAFVSTFDPALVTSIVIAAGEGNDNIYVHGIKAATPIFIAGEAGDDAIVVGNGDLDSNVLSELNVNGGTGSDTWILNDTTDAGNDAYTFTPTTFTKTGLAIFNHSSIEELSIQANQQINTLNLTGGAGMTAVYAYGNNGDDTFNVGGGNLDSVLAGGNVLNLIGGAGLNTATFNDSTDTGSDSYTLTSLLFTKTGVGSIDYTQLASMTISAGSGASIININSVIASEPVTVNGNGGNDTFNIGNGDVDSNIQANVLLNGNAGTDTVVFNDYTDTAGSDSYSISGTFFDKPAGGDISYATMESVQLNASANADTVTVPSVASGMSMTINGANGNDTITAAGGDFDGSILGNLIVNGNAGTDQLVMNDTTDTGLGSYEFNTSFVGKSTTAGGVIYQTIEGITVNGSGQSSTYGIEATSTGVPLVINANNGNDTFNLALSGGNLNNLPSPITIVGGAGVDQILLFDNVNPAGTTYTVTNNQVTRPNFGGLTYGGTNGNESVFVSAGSGSDTFNLNTVASGIPVTVAGGAGDDVFNVGNGNLEANILASVSVIGGNHGASGDLLIIDDSLDTGNDTYVVTSSSVTKNTMSSVISHNSMEAVGIQGNSGNNDFDVSSSATSLTLLGNLGNDRLLGGGGGQDLSAITGPVSLSGGAGTDAVVLNDQNNAADGQFTISSSSVQRSGGSAISFSAAESLALNSGTGNSTFDIQGVSVNTPLSLNMGGGNDTADIGSAINLLNTFGGLIALNAGAGTDSVVLNDSGGAFAADYAITSSLVSRTLAGGFAGMSYSQLEQLRLNATQSGNGFAVASLGATTALILGGNGGDDRFDLGGAAGTVEPIDGTLTLDGGAGTDLIQVNDQSNPAIGGFTITSTTIARSGMGTATYGTVEQLQINSSGATSKLHTINSTAPGTPIDMSPGNARDIFQIHETAPTGPVTIRPSSGGDNVEVNTDGAGAARVLFDSSITLGSISVGRGGSAALLPHGQRVLRTATVSVADGGALDVADNAMIVDYTGGSPIATIQSLLTSGYNAGSWNGSGINSSIAAVTPNRALGFAEATDIGSPSTFAGESIDNTSILVRFTISGDADLNRAVDVNDLGILASNWQQSPRRWSQGNFDYSATGVDVNDLGILASNWQQSLAGAAASSSAPGTRTPTGKPRPLRESLFSTEKLQNRSALIAVLDQLPRA